jgi:hypothetical protein
MRGLSFVTFGQANGPDGCYATALRIVAMLQDLKRFRHGDGTASALKSERFWLINRALCRPEAIAGETAWMP